MRKNPNLRQLENLLGKIRKDVDAGLSRFNEIHQRLEVFAFLLELADAIAMALDLLRDGLDEAPNLVTSPGLRADPPIAALRAYRSELLKMFATASGTEEGNEELARLSKEISREPKPGSELIDACQILAWYLQINLFVQTQAEAANVTGLPGESVKDQVDEAMRAATPERLADQMLARVKLSVIGGSDERKHGRVRKDIGRRRGRIDADLASFEDLFRTAVDQACQVYLRTLPQQSLEMTTAQKYLSSLKDLGRPESRSVMKKWITAMLALGPQGSWS